MNKYLNVSSIEPNHGNKLIALVMEDLKTKRKKSSFFCNLC